MFAMMEDPGQIEWHRGMLTLIRASLLNDEKLPGVPGGYFKAFGTMLRALVDNVEMPA
jgi:hypothetical protein